MIRLVLACGVFDILHAGHVELLEFAKEQGHLLVVGINTDESVALLGKQPGPRPVLPYEERAAVVTALRCVDFVCPIEKPEDAIRAWKPNVYVKGRDYPDLSVMPERDILAELGVEYICFDQGRHMTRTTSDIIRKINALASP